MPANHLRGYQLHQHLVQSAANRPPELARLLWLHPAWSTCDAGCGWPVDPTAGTTHPGCEDT